MAAATAMLHTRMDQELKAKATETLAAMGLTTADAVRLLFHRIVADQAFPLELKVPNAETRAAIEEARIMIEEQRARYSDPVALFAELDGQDGQKAR